MVIWKCPPVGCLKLNIDGAFVKETGAGGVGLVLRDSFGQFLLGKGKSMFGLLSAEHAELLACKEAFLLIVEYSLQPVIVETDALTVEQQLTGMGNNLSLLGRIYDDLGFLLKEMPNVCLVHTRREANKATHLMAAQASSTGLTFLCSEVSSFLASVITSESCNQ
ncbi:uncharacterized protein LOC112184787 [Rosa chinensis]|uniref:uncharacterized protein LOC112184787 n=1 Tax=Rosa chinensis TaxID=74649 RepID=UPI000D08EA55|nr:uncharacterized protein LOC112184787 [Rosa chinensis]